MIEKIVSRVRRNHGLEHATIHVLSERHKGFGAQGNSTYGGFYLNIFGELTERDVASAVEEAHRRLKGGEVDLALHPNCGTVLLTAATMAALAAQATFSLERWRQRRSGMDLTVLVNALPAAVMATALSLIASRPLGMAIQENFTVEGKIGDLQVVEVRRINPPLVARFFQMLLGHAGRKHMKSYRVKTAG